MCQTSNYCRIQKLTLQFGHRLQFIGSVLSLTFHWHRKDSKKPQPVQQSTTIFFLFLIETESLFHSEMLHTAEFAKNEFILQRKFVLEIEVQKLQIEIQSNPKK